MKTLIILPLLLISLNSFAKAYKLAPGIYKAIESEVELCDQDIRPVYNRNGILNGIYVQYTGMCYAGPYYYSCNSKRITNECFNIGHRFTIIKDNTFKWINETVDIGGVFTKAD